MGLKMFKLEITSKVNCKEQMLYFHSEIEVTDIKNVKTIIDVHEKCKFKIYHDNKLLMEV